jgi:hypothetical protein
MDTSPEPQNIVLLGTVVVCSLAGAISIPLVGLYIRRKVGCATRIHVPVPDWDAKERLLVPLLFSLFLPTGIHFQQWPSDPALWSLGILGIMGVFSISPYPLGPYPGITFFVPFSDLNNPTNGPYYGLSYVYWFPFGLLCCFLSIALIRYFWLVLWGDIRKPVLRRATFGIVVFFVVLGVITATVPLPIVPLAVLLQLSRVEDAGAK